VDHMGFDGLLRHPKPFGDAAVRETFRHEGEHLALARRESAKGTAAASHEALDELRIHDDLSPGDPLDGLGQLADAPDAVLEQVAAASFRILDRRNA
jgi:hypothetical protein